MQGLSGGCGLAVQALVAAVAVGELALCSPPPSGSQLAQSASDDSSRLPTSASAIDSDVATAAPAAAGEAAAAAALSTTAETDRSRLLMSLLNCSLELADQAQVAMRSPEGSDPGPAAAGRSGSGSTVGSRQRRPEDRAADAQLRAAQAAGRRLMVTALAGLAGLMSVAAVAQGPAATPSAASGPAPQHPANALHRKRMRPLLLNSVSLAVEVLAAAKGFPELAADFIEVLPLLMPYQAGCVSAHPLLVFANRPAALKTSKGCTSW
jgi:hypothetical protein